MEGNGHDAPAGEPVTELEDISKVEQYVLVAGVASENGSSSAAKGAKTACLSSGPAEAGSLENALPSGSSTEPEGIRMANISDGPTQDKVTDQDTIDLETAVNMESATWAKMVRDQKMAHWELNNEQDVRTLRNGASDAPLDTADVNKDGAAIQGNGSDTDGVGQGGANGKLV